MELTLNEQDYSSDEVLFEYQPDAHLAELRARPDVTPAPRRPPPEHLRPAAAKRALMPAAEIVISRDLDHLPGRRRARA